MKNILDVCVFWSGRLCGVAEDGPKLMGFFLGGRLGDAWGEGGDTNKSFTFAWLPLTSRLFGGRGRTKAHGGWGGRLGGGGMKNLRIAFFWS